MIPQINNYFEFTQHVLQCFPNEACGFVIDGSFVPATNTADTPHEDFRISSEEYIKASSTGKLEAIVHSHPKPIGTDVGGRLYDPRTPSMNDLQGQQDTNIPWGIVSTEGENVSQMLWYGLDTPAPLLERPFIHNVYDCYTLVRDYYNTVMNIRLGVYPRPANWKDFDKNIYERNYKTEGFVPINNLNEAQVGDLIFFRVMSRDYIDHAGIWLGDNKFMHHQYNKLSCVESLDRWMKHVAYVSHNTRVDKR